MHVLEFLAILRKRWLYVVVPTLLGIGGALTLTLITTPIYQATANVYFSLPYGESASDLFQGSNYTQKQLASYASLATLPVVLEPVVDELQLEVGPQALANQVDAVASNDTVLIEIRASDPSPAQAAAIANSVADQLAVVVRDLSPRGADGQPSVDVSIVAEAVPPTSPSTPQTQRNLVAGALGGLLLGILLAIARDRLDTRVRGPKDLPADVASLAAVPLDKSARSAPLIPTGGIRSSRTEVYRRLRTNLQFVDVAQPAKVILVTSSVADEGKSSTSANLAITFAEAGKRVLLIDADLRRPKVDEYLGLEGSAGLSNVLVGQASVDDVLQRWGRTGMTVLPSGSIPPNPSELLGSQTMEELVGELRRRFDTIIIDAAPLLPVTDAAVASVHSDGVLIVVRYGKTTRTQLASAVQSLRSVDARILGCVLNMTPIKGVDAMRYDGYGYYEDDPNRRPLVATTDESPSPEHGTRPGHNAAEPPAAVASTPTGQQATASRAGGGAEPLSGDSVFGSAGRAES